MYMYKCTPMVQSFSYYLTEDFAFRFANNMADLTSFRNELCVKEVNLEVLQLILQRRPSLTKEMEAGGMSPFIVLSRRRCSVDIVKLLLHYGADPNFRMNGDGPPPLYFALHYRASVGIVKALVEGGARITQGYDNIVHAALGMRAEIDVIKVLVSAGGDLFRTGIGTLCPLFHALKYSKYFNVSAFGSLLDIQDVDVNTVRNYLDGSLLHSALIRRNGCPAVFAKFLIDRGIGVSSVDYNDFTPLHVALLNPVSQSDLFDLLLRRGSPVNVLSRSGITPLDLALERHCNPVDTAQLLLKYCLLQNSDFDVENWTRGHESRGMLSGYANDCKCELQRMNSEIVGNGRTLLEFLQTYSGNQMSTNGEEGFDVDQLLRIIADRHYPLYCNVISSKLELSLLKVKLEECNIYTVKENGSDVRSLTKTIFLKNDCVRILANYLDENDLLSMLIAFRN